MKRPRYRLSPGNGPRPVSLEPADDCEGSLLGALWCERCGAVDEEEALGSCDGSGVEDDGKPQCRAWCNPPEDERERADELKVDNWRDEE